MAGNYLHMWLLIAIVFEAVAISEQTGCKLDGSHTAKSCAQLYRALESALISNEDNIFALRKMFFSSPVASVVLLKVNYMVDFFTNMTRPKSVFPLKGNYTSEFIHNITESDFPCIIVYIGDNSTHSLNNSMCTSTFTEQYRRNMMWTSSGVYTLLDPLLINLLQLQLPFFLLRLFRGISDNNPEVAAFLWDGSYELPSVTLHLRNLSHLPTDDDTLQYALEDLTVRVSLNS